MEGHTQREDGQPLGAGCQRTSALGPQGHSTGGVAHLAMSDREASKESACAISI